MSALKICPTCGTEYPANERFCPRDGTALRTQGGGNDLVGSILAERYHVLKKLGEGGMGQVYLAEHVKMGRRSAVKVMHPAMVNDADAIGRFNREAANASRINHPNVAGIYDFGETADGLVYLAMEFVQGETLSELLDASGALPAARAADIARQTADALHVAHELGIVHRDLKPDNIMITKDHDGRDSVKVVDFGIAKAAGNESQKVTRTGLVVGTPEYMSPEQLSGDALDGRSDLYSLGLVTFTMLTGKLPFPSDTTQSSMIMRLTEEPRALREMKGDVEWPAELQAVMTKALKRNVAERYQKVREFSAALTAATRLMPAQVTEDDGTRVMTPPSVAAAPAADRPAAPPASRSRAPLLAGAAVVVLAVTGALVFLHGKAAPVPAQPTAERSVAVAAPVAAPPAAVPVAVPVSPPADSSAAAASAAPPAISAADSAALARDLRIALAHASDEGTARTALAEAEQLSTRVARPEDKVRVAMVRAQAYGTLGQDSRSCQALRDVVDAGRGTRYESALTGALARCK